jgi:hypothetical protein
VRPPEQNCRRSQEKHIEYDNNGESSDHTRRGLVCACRPTDGLQLRAAGPPGH